MKNIFFICNNSPGDVHYVDDTFRSGIKMGENQASYSRMSNLLTHADPRYLVNVYLQNSSPFHLRLLQLSTLLLNLYPAFKTEMYLISEINSCYQH